MDSTYLLERRIIAICFNPIRDSVFLLFNERLSKLSKINIGNENILTLTEEDLSKNIIYRRFKLLKKHECNIINTTQRKIPNNTYEGYFLYFWELTSKLFVIYPFGYISIYDYNTSQLLYHFQCHGKRTYVIRNIIGSPMQKSLFFSADGMHNVYHINYDNIQLANSKNGIIYNKLILPEGEVAYDVVPHPIEKFIFIACSDGIVHIFDYNDTNKIKEVKNCICDINCNSDIKNQIKMIKENKIGKVMSIDVNLSGDYLISGNENGRIYLWDALLAIKEKKILFTQRHVSFSGILSLKFLKTKQFQNLQRFICLTKEGSFFIFAIINKEENINNSQFNNYLNANLSSSVLNVVLKKQLVLEKFYENIGLFNSIIYSLDNYVISTSNFIQISYHTNIISISWPNLKLEKIKKDNNKSDNYLLFPSFDAKLFFFYDNLYPKINFPISSQLSPRLYEDYIPSNKQKNFESLIFYVDNFFIYLYEIITGTSKRLINYTKEFNLKNVYPLKFDYKDKKTSFFFIILIENELNKISCLMIEYDILSNAIKKSNKIENVIDFVFLGNRKNNNQNDLIYMLSKDKQTGIIYSISSRNSEQKPIESTVKRIYNTPFNNGYCILYRNMLDELRFSENYIPFIQQEEKELKENPYKLDEGNPYNNNNDDIQSKLSFKLIQTNMFKLDYNEREIDVIFHEYDKQIYCIISMIEKIVILNDKMKVISTYKTSLNDNPNLISSLFFIGKTLIYSKGNNIIYYYWDDNINQKIFTNNRPTTFISGVLSDRFILTSQNNKDNIESAIISTPMLNPLEPILIGYLDSKSIDFNLVRECVVNMFTNQISEFLIDKFVKMNLKEVAWLFISDTKNSFQNIDKKVNILNDMLKFDKVLENILINKDLKNEMHLDEIIWKMKYDQGYEYIKNILTRETRTLIKYGQFDKAIKILELLGDYPKILNLLLISTSREEFERLRVMFQAKNCLSFTDNLLINNAFCLKFKNDELNPYNMNHYNKILDKYPGENFIFGANQDKLNVLSIKNIENKIIKKTSYITNIQKKILNYGESSYTLYADSYNISADKFEQNEICSLILQKIEQYYGMNNTIFGNNNQKPKPNFQDFHVGLNQVQSSNNFNNNENDINNQNDDNDNDIDPNINIEEISENLFLSLYYHCDKGSGNLVEDITENNNEGKLIFVENKLNSNNDLNSNLNINNLNQNNFNSFENQLWSNVLDEFEPLEYEDKWGRKSPGAHSIKFNKYSQVKMIVKNSPSLNHMNKKFTIEMWIKLNSLNVTIIQKDTFSVEIENGEFKIKYQNNLLQGEKIKEYNLTVNQFMHVSILYKKKSGFVNILLNCELIIQFQINLDSININSDIIFGNGNLDGELTEIKIWNQEMPINYLAENYRTPLPILAENKKKLKMKINKQDNTHSKRFDFKSGNFMFGNRESSINQNVINGLQGIDNSNNFNNDKNNYDFNPGDPVPIDLENSIQYPSLNSVVGDNEIKNSNFNNFNFDIPDNNNNNIFGDPNNNNFKDSDFQFGFGFDEINNQNFNNQGNNDFFGNSTNFNFDK